MIRGIKSAKNWFAMAGLQGLLQNGIGGLAALA
jgi:hypothetical protein